MLLGLQPLLGNEVPGYFMNANQKKPQEWKTSSPLKGITIKEPYSLKDPHGKIAVLYSNLTASSGETTAICFIGKPDARYFGDSTAGLTTGNRVFNLSDGNILALASSYTMDRNKKIYASYIIPDVLVEKGEIDNVLAKAVAWLKE